MWFVPGPVYRKYLRRHGVSTALRDLPPVRTLDVARRRAVHPLLGPSATPVAARLWQLARLVRELRRHRAAVGLS